MPLSQSLRRNFHGGIVLSTILKVLIKFFTLEKWPSLGSMPYLIRSLETAQRKGFPEGSLFAHRPISLHPPKETSHIRTGREIGSLQHHFIFGSVEVISHFIDGLMVSYLGVTRPIFFFTDDQPIASA